ncbi:hypothetical protein [Vibrio nigripulchritudo]|uniref:hypothetical protein n=1 Tax=Vibrio nigripulchritudo TaxID=28173 RepID=UPI0005FA8FAA|nr:hypothetical protein [Vibrio nigripulchritudo]KJY80544.1 hypothetical protein TW74_05380 [Vibrio nigripulchritudo]
MKLSYSLFPFITPFLLLGCNTGSDTPENTLQESNKAPYRISKEIVYFDDDDIYDVSYTTTYNDDGYIIKEHGFKNPQSKSNQISSLNGHASMTMRYEYDSTNRIIEVEKLYEGKSEYIEKYQYENGQLVRVNLYYANSDSDKYFLFRYEDNQLKELKSFKSNTNQVDSEEFRQYRNDGRLALLTNDFGEQIVEWDNNSRVSSINYTPRSNSQGSNRKRSFSYTNGTLSKIENSSDGKITSDRQYILSSLTNKYSTIKIFVGVKEDTRIELELEDGKCFQSLPPIGPFSLSVTRQGNLKSINHSPCHF